MLEKSYSDNFDNKAAKGIHKTDPKTQPIIGAFVQLYFFIVGAGAVPVRLFLRDNFGERSITPMALSVSVFLHLWYVYVYVVEFQTFGLMPSLSVSGDETLSNILLIFIVLTWLFNGFTYYLYEIFIKRGKKHFQDIIKKGQAGVNHESSYYRGDGKYFRQMIGSQLKTPLGEFEVDEKIMRMLIEPKKMIRFGFFMFFIPLVIALLLSWIPLGIVQLGVLLVLSFSAVGLMLVLSSICLFLEELGIFLRIRGAALDILDGEKDLKLVMTTKDELTVNSEKNNPKTLKQEQFYPLVKIH